MNPATKGELPAIKPKEVDVVIPVYNEGSNIIATLAALRSGLPCHANFLICYDRDEDSTLKALESFDPAPHEIVLVKNAGVGAHGAVLTGFKASRSASVLVYPADDDYNGPCLKRLVELFREGNEIVAASRFMNGGSMIGCPWQKAFLVRSAAITLFHLAGLPTRDPTNGLRLFSRRVITSIPIESKVGFAYSLELLVKAHRLGMRISETPATWIERRAGKSRFRLYKWLPEYLRWYRYAFATSWLRKKSQLNTVESGMISNAD